ncbi:hypothetical protein ACCT09_16350, partial [Rhizobium ruizarguesonis]
ACIGRRRLEARMPYPARTGSGRIETLGFHGKKTASGNEQGFGKQGRSPVASPSNQLESLTLYGEQPATGEFGFCPGPIKLEEPSGKAEILRSDDRSRGIVRVTAAIFRPALFRE